MVVVIVGVITAITATMVFSLTQGGNVRIAFDQARVSMIQPKSHASQSRRPCNAWGLGFRDGH